MTKRYREAIDQVELAPGGVRAGPVEFRWRGRRYRVTRVLGHWREDPGWWRRADGQAIRIEQADRWRVEAANGATPGFGVYELVRCGGRWRLDRVWD